MNGSAGLWQVDVGLMQGIGLGPGALFSHGHSATYLGVCNNWGSMSWASFT